jgi:hypothetical protein
VFHVLAVEVSTLKQYTITFTSFGGISRVVLFDVLAVGVSTLTRYTVTFTTFGGISRVVLFDVVAVYVFTSCQPSICRVSRLKNCFVVCVVLNISCE